MKKMRWGIVVGMLALRVSNTGGVMANDWEVWLSDQSDSADISAENPSGTFGSRIIIYEGRNIVDAPPGTYGEDHAMYGPTVIEAHHVFPNALSELGVNVDVLHGMLPHPDHRYLNANFFGPGVGLVGIIDARGQCGPAGGEACGPIRGGRRDAGKLAAALFRTTGPEGSAPRNHMSFWTADGTKLIVANLSAKLLERIDYDAETGLFTFNRAATLDLVGGRNLAAMPAMADSTLPMGRVTGVYANFQSTLTPSGALREGPGRPNNVVICPIPEQEQPSRLRHVRRRRPVRRRPDDRADVDRRGIHQRRHQRRRVRGGRGRRLHVPERGGVGKPCRGRRLDVHTVSSAARLSGRSCG